MLLSLNEQQLRALKFPASQQLYNYFYLRTYAAKLILLYLSAEDLPSSTSSTTKASDRAKTRSYRQMLPLEAMRNTARSEAANPSPVRVESMRAALEAPATSNQSPFPPPVDLDRPLYDQMVADSRPYADSTNPPEWVWINELGITTAQFVWAYEYAAQFLPENKDLLALVPAVKL